MTIIKKSLLLTAFGLLCFISCKEAPKQEAQKEEVSTLETNKKNNILVGSWTEPIPGQEKEMQGIKINEDGTAESINMSTLLHKKWWKQDNKLFLVSESIGNHTRSIDTTEYSIITLNDKELVLKDRNYTIKYKKQ